MMVGLVVFISLTLLAACQADVAVDPPVRCGEMPMAIYRCLGTPRLVKPAVSAQCDKNLLECEKITCIFKKSGWMNGDQIDKAKLTAYFDQYARDSADWRPAVERMKSSCLQADLPPQGVHLDCPAYDAMQCSFATFIKHAQPSQWSSAPTCESARLFAAKCPICPSACFAARIPAGTCNACLALPRSP